MRAAGLRSFASDGIIKARIDFIGLDFEKHPPVENAVKIVKWSGTFTAKLKLS
jgi:hypothetical protein